MKPKAVELTLPARWASYLVNGDASGLATGDREMCDKALARYSLTAGECVTVGDEEWFSWTNDADGFGATVALFTFFRSETPATANR